MHCSKSTQFNSNHLIFVFVYVIRPKICCSAKCESFFSLLALAIKKPNTNRFSELKICINLEHSSVCLTMHKKTRINLLVTYLQLMFHLVLTILFEDKAEIFQSRRQLVGYVDFTCS